MTEPETPEEFIAQMLRRSAQLESIPVCDDDKHVVDSIGICDICGLVTEAFFDAHGP